jgi:hypothetical protein
VNTVGTHTYALTLLPNIDSTVELDCTPCPPQEILGPVGHLRNPLLRERHWQAIAGLLGQALDRTPGASTSIQQLLDLQVGFMACARPLSGLGALQ